MTEKRKPTYELWAIKEAFASVEGLRGRSTVTALRTAAAIGFSPGDVIETIHSVKRVHFVKSMTSHADHRIWQDVYHVPSRKGVLYIKFSEDKVTGFILLSFKGKGNG